MSKAEKKANLERELEQRYDPKVRAHEGVKFEFKDSSYIMRHGKLCEPLLMCWTLEALPRANVREIGFTKMPGMPGVGASPDGIMREPVVEEPPLSVQSAWHEHIQKFNKDTTITKISDIDINNCTLELKTSYGTPGSTEPDKDDIGFNGFYILQVAMEMAVTDSWRAVLAKIRKGDPRLKVYTIYRNRAFEAKVHC